MHAVLATLRAYLPESQAFLSGRLCKVTASKVRSLLRMNFREGNAGANDRQTGMGFLMCIKATKGIYYSTFADII